MRNPARIPAVLAYLGEVWAKHPDLRFGQLLLNAMPHLDGELYHIEDEDLMTYLARTYVPQDVQK